MKDILKNILIIVLIAIILILMFNLIKIHKNYQLIKAIDNVNSLYVDTAINDYHINIKRSAENELDQSVDIYRKGNEIKTIVSENNETTNIYYENLDTGENIKYSKQDNNITNCTSSYANSYLKEYQNFLQRYYQNLEIAKIKQDSEYIIVNFNNSNYYFNKENYRLMKTDISDDTHILIEDIFSYNDNETITSKMIEKPVI